MSPGCRNRGSRDDADFAIEGSPAEPSDRREGTAMTAERIGFIGLGRMGRPMAMRIHEAGFPLTVYDVAEAALEPFRARGIATAPSPREIADTSEIVFACIPSPEASHSVALGKDGIAEGKAVRVYVECSTIGPDHIAEIAEGLAPTGIAFLDAPISGGVPGAEQGTLSVVVAGPPAMLERVRPAMSAYAANIFHVSERPGPAQIAKLINNMLSTTGTVAAFEGMVFGAKAGLDVEALLDFINVSTGRNVATMQKIPANILTRTFGGNMKIGVKDLGLFVEQAEKHGIKPFIAPRVQEVFKAAIASGYDKETMRIIEFLEERAGGVVVKGKAEA
ncbi:NAD(P)-dependent oxidoreductase [Faunimonas sp. B44]|uniref:NAD(P)-dependent oxidoreductase n=1 Tax=Faunimonas sp. B44 TaxID=3461493 RepID=UPI004044E888